MTNDFEREFCKQYNINTMTYESIPITEAEPYWQKRREVLLKRSRALAIALLGVSAADSWWTSANLAFEGQTPTQYFETNPEQVYSYLMTHADGGYW
jgi:hypothetical protein